MNKFRKNVKQLELHGKTLFWSLLCVLLLVTSLYVYFVNTAAMNGVRWGEAQEEITSRGAAVSELESTYLSLKQSVTLATAYAKGFQDARNIVFVSAQKVGAVARAREL